MNEWQAKFAAFPAIAEWVKELNVASTITVVQVSPKSFRVVTKGEDNHDR